jgi:hypothetical protein
LDKNASDELSLLAFIYDRGQAGEVEEVTIMNRSGRREVEEVTIHSPSYLLIR